MFGFELPHNWPNIHRKESRATPHILPKKSPLMPTYRCLSVCVGQNPVNLHFALVHLVDIYPQVLAHLIGRAVGFGRVVVMICVLL